MWQIKFILKNWWKYYYFSGYCIDIHIVNTVLSLPHICTSMQHSKLYPPYSISCSLYSYRTPTAFPVIYALTSFLTKQQISMYLYSKILSSLCRNSGHRTRTLWQTLKMYRFLHSDMCSMSSRVNRIPGLFQFLFPGNEAGQLPEESSACCC